MTNHPNRNKMMKWLQTSAGWSASGNLGAYSIYQNSAGRYDVKIARKGMSAKRLGDAPTLAVAQLVGRRV